MAVLFVVPLEEDVVSFLAAGVDSDFFSGVGDLSDDGLSDDFSDVAAAVAGDFASDRLSVR